MSNVSKTVPEQVSEKTVSNNSVGIQLQRVLNRILNDRPIMLVVLIVLLSLFMSIRYPKVFPHADNFAAVLLDAAQGGILVVGMLVLLIGGVFDLSAGSTLAFSGIVAGVMVKDIGLPPFISLLAGVFTGLIIGTINGLIITKFRINALITTLAMQGILRGVTQIISPSGVANLPEGFKPFGQTVILGLQSPFWVMITVVVVFWYLLSRTRYFRQFYYVGSNSKAATLSGINVSRVTLVGFATMGMLAGLAGTMLASRLSNAVLLAGTGVELKAITAALLGGASLAGGLGTVPGAFLGVLFMSLIQNTLIISKVPVFWQSIVVGFVLLLAIGVDQLGNKRK